MLKLYIQDPEVRRKVVIIATQLLAKAIAEGRLDQDNKTQMKMALEEACQTALIAYNAAEEFLAG